MSEKKKHTFTRTKSKTAALKCSDFSSYVHKGGSVYENIQKFQSTEDGTEFGTHFWNKQLEDRSFLSCSLAWILLHLVRNI